MKHFKRFLMVTALVFTFSLNTAVTCNGTVLASLIIEAITKVTNVIKEGKDLQQLAAILSNTFVQINELKTSNKTLTEQKEKMDEALQFLQDFKQACQTTKYVYYAGKNVANFYSSIGDYWNYAKTKGFSSFSRSISTVNKGLRYAQSAMRDAIAIANILNGKDEDGKSVQFDAATRSSKIRALFSRINKSYDSWEELVLESGIGDVGLESSRALEKEFTDTEGYFSPVNVSFIPQGSPFEDIDIISNPERLTL